MNKIDKSLTKTVKTSDLQNVSTDLTEVILDSMLDDGILKDIPILGSIVGMGKTASTIKDALFLKKIIYFLTELKDIPIEQREKMIDSIDNSEKQKIKIGEKLIFILDKCDDYLDAKYIGQFFRGFLESQITYEEFLQGARIIQNIYNGDLEYFLGRDLSKIEIEASTEEAPDDDTFPLINSGICGFGYNPTRVEDQRDYEISDKYIVKGGEVVIWITSIGKKLKDILKIE
ncbi:hypothetical protein [Galbibacter pacificus]|uniref:DUF4393 domain-containing protein n=1 Tax=Galbibacter pacificus TaxID=2996052 RepID=A0ABT6FMJ9_9FLAO|nr:hypothetical protein [Galbibacter pacificus]MDG3581008.1 hypothetical protein [Galbibacter pacificus]MDG3584486.1 hypothetical protein [Galbibacter pacificus]